MGRGRQAKFLVHMAIGPNCPDVPEGCGGRRPNPRGLGRLLSGAGRWHGIRTFPLRKVLLDYWARPGRPQR